MTHEETPMRVRLDLPAGGNGWEKWLEEGLPHIPRTGEFFTLNGVERSIRHVIWHLGEMEGYRTHGPWVQIVLKPNADDL